MFFVGNLPILVSVQSVLAELNAQLKINGQTGLEHGRIINNQLVCSCPFHRDNKPSFSILLNSNGDKTAGLWHCFSCKQSGNLPKLVSKLLFNSDSNIYGEDWLVSNFSDFEVENRETALKLPHRNADRLHNQCMEKQYISEEELSSYAYYHPYFDKRHLTNDIIEWYDIGYDKATNSMTMPVYNSDGKVEFIVKRNVSTKRFDMPRGIDKILYGVYQMYKLFPNTHYCYITESIMNCLTLVGHFHVPSIALLGTGSNHQYELLKQLPIREYIIALDNDKAGNLGRDKLIDKLKPFKFIKVLETPSNGLDINDCWNDKNLLDKITVV